MIDTRPRLLWVLLAALFAAASAAAMFGQTYQGGVRGQVTDAQGADIPRVRVVLTNEATKIGRVSVTNSAGQYVFPAVEPGTYALSLSASGFTGIERHGIVVGVQQFLTLDFEMSVGSVNQTVVVTAAVPLINVSNASNGQVLDTQKLKTLPPVTRNPYLFERLDNNVAVTSTPSGNTKSDDQNGISQVTMAGGPVASNNYLVDGVPITDLNNRSVIIPTIEAVKEIDVQANTYDAEIGRTGGGTFNTVLNSGTNGLHGSLFGQTQQTNWAAHPFFFKPGAAYNVDYYNYAGSIGGPVVIPHVYDGRNKTFFFISEEGYRQRNANTAQYYVPTAAERAGDFSASSVKLYNPFAPLVPCPPPYKASQMCRQPFSGGRIPSNLLNPVGQAIVNLLPQPDLPVTSYGKTDYIQSVFPEDHVDEFTGKLDHQFFPWWYANFSYMHYASHNPSANPLGILAGGPGTHVLLRKVDAIEQNDTFTLNPTTVLTLGYGFNRFPNNTLDQSNGFNQTQLGLPASYVKSMQKASFPGITMQTAASLGANNPGWAVFYSRSFVANLAKSLGRHSLKAGFDFRTLSVDFTDTTFSNGNYAFSNVFTEELPNAGNVSTGADVADLLLGLPTTGVVTTTSPLRMNVHYYGAYFQDAFRATPRITLNAGLRYERELGIRERDNHFAVGFDPSVINPISQPSGVKTLGGIEFAGVNGYPSQCCDKDHPLWSPRFGVAFSLNSTTVLRAGYGIFFAPVFYTANSSIAPGYTQTSVYVASNDGDVTPANSLSNPFPSGIQQPTGNSLGYSTGVGNQLTLLDRSLQSPYVQEYSADVQRELPWRMALKIGYVGAKGIHLLTSSTGAGTAANVVAGGTTPGALNIDQLPDSALSLGAQLLAKVPNPYYQPGGNGILGSPTVAYNQLLRPFPEFSSINVLSSSAKSLYNAFNIKLQKNFSSGVTLLAAYTYSSSWDSTWGTIVGVNPGPYLPQDASNLNMEYSRSLDDIPQRFSVATTLELPFGRGRALRSGNRALDSMIGGWSAAAVGVIQSGAPLSIYQNTNNNAVLGAGSQRPNLVGDPCGSGSPESRLSQYLNPTAFATAPAFTYGNAPRTLSCLGPGVANWDLSLYKNVRFEKFTVSFQAEAMNAFNTPEFAAPVRAFGAPTFGEIQSQINYPRFLLLGGRISF